MQWASPLPPLGLRQVPGMSEELLQQVSAPWPVAGLRWTLACPIPVRGLGDPWKRRLKQWWTSSAPAPGIWRACSRCSGIGAWSYGVNMWGRCRLAPSGSVSLRVPMAGGEHWRSARRTASSCPATWRRLCTALRASGRSDLPGHLRGNLFGILFRGQISTHVRHRIGNS